jgi:hypothetical protein
VSEGFAYTVTKDEIEAVLYLKSDRKIAQYFGIEEERVAAVRAERRPEKLLIAADSDPEPAIAEALEKPLPAASRESVLAPCLCPTCGAPVKGERLLVTHVQALVAAYFKTPVREMTSSRRFKEVTWPRQVAMYLAYELTERSLPEIGQRFGGRDHTTVIHAIKQVQKRMLEDAEVEADVKALRERLAA